jgi:hypothetical protein
MVRLDSVLNSWKTVREDTALAVEDFSAHELDYKPSPDMMSFGDLARHILEAGHALTGALLVDRLLASENEQQALRRSAPVIVWLAVFVSVLVLWRALTIEETRVIQHSTSLVAADARGHVARDLEARI